MLFPHGHAHILCDTLTSPLSQAVQLNYEEYREHRLFPSEGEEPQMVMLCGAFHIEHSSDFPLLQFLPNVIHLPGEQGRMAPGFADIVRFMTNESVSRQSGTEVMLRRLTEMLFIQVVRFWIDQ